MVTGQPVNGGLTEGLADDTSTTPRAYELDLDGNESPFVIEYCDVRMEIDAQIPDRALHRGVLTTKEEFRHVGAIKNLTYDRVNYPAGERRLRLKLRCGRERG